MKKIHKIKYTPLAREDLLKIFSYVSGDLSAPQSAFKLLNNIETAVRRLQEHPYSAPEANDRYLTEQSYRNLVCKKYLIFYKVNAKKHLVEIHRIVYGKRNLNWLF
ncbi:MAG: type II toxin-antitoxin system RelE/ParE family toxin [Candidatus Margulisbacteria bacterium]|jgi:addiction module RelE/StbE family toxin|nr:type II toxin-antitoxin system RelE/ParE family toxin [Candidatus Margulisiibacteriota bacterium]